MSFANNIHICIRSSEKLFATLFHGPGPAPAPAPYQDLTYQVLAEKQRILSDTWTSTLLPPPCKDTLTTFMKYVSVFMMLEVISLEPLMNYILCCDRQSP